MPNFFSVREKIRVRTSYQKRKKVLLDLIKEHGLEAVEETFESIKYVLDSIEVK